MLSASSSLILWMGTAGSAHPAKYVGVDISAVRRQLQVAALQLRSTGTARRSGDRCAQQARACRPRGIAGV